MNLVVKFSNEPEAVSLEITSFSLSTKSIKLQYMVGNLPSNHWEKSENIERLRLEAAGRRASMKLLREKPSAHEVKLLTVSGGNMILEDITGNVTMQHQASLAQLEYLEIE